METITSRYIVFKVCEFGRTLARQVSASYFTVMDSKLKRKDGKEWASENYFRLVCITSLTSSSTLHLKPVESKGEGKGAYPCSVGVEV